MNQVSSVREQHERDHFMTRFISCLDRLNGQTVHRLRSFFDQDVTYENPFMHARGKQDALHAVSSLHAGLNVQRMKVIDYGFAARNPYKIFLNWEMRIAPSSHEITITGMSEIDLSIHQGEKIAFMRDLWDPSAVLNARGGRLFSFARSRAQNKLF